MSSSSVSPRLISVSILAVVAMQLSLIHSVWSLNQTNAYLRHICINGEGKSDSKYESKVKDIIHLLSASLDYGYGNGGYGEANNTDNDVNAKFQCRGDASESNLPLLPWHRVLCRNIRRKCPNDKGRIIWYDNCVLDLSSVSTEGKIDYKHTIYLYNAKDVSGDKKLFDKNTKALLYKLKEKASSKEQKPYRKDYMYATGEESLGTMKLYAMVQCTQDLSVKDCRVCLDWITAKLERCCNGKQGARVLNPSCNFRYELYPFVKT